MVIKFEGYQNFLFSVCCVDKTFRGPVTKAHEKSA